MRCFGRRGRAVRTARSYEGLGIGSWRFGVRWFEAYVREVLSEHHIIVYWRLFEILGFSNV